MEQDANSTPLETGWLTSTPADDTLLRQFVLNMAESWVAVAEAAGGRVHRADHFVAADLGRPSGMFNSAVLTRPLHDADFSAVIDSIADFYREGTGTVMLWSPFPAPDLTERGWVLEGHPPVLIRPPGAVSGHASDELTVTEVSDPEALDTWCRTVVEGFPFEDLLPYQSGSLLPEAILTDDRFRFVTGSSDGRPVCAGSQFVSHGLNVLFLSACLPDGRGRGFYKALVEHRLAERPDMLAAAIVSDLSRPILTGRFEFLPMIRTTLWVRPRPGRR